MKNTVIPFPSATLGTVDAINSPPLLITPQDQGGLIKGSEEISTTEISDRKMLGMPEWTWQTCSKSARIVLEHMRRCTPKGAKPPWRSSPSVTPIQRLLDEGVSMDELMELVEGSAMLVTSGKQAARWWYPSNVFGPKTVERWIADVGELQAAQAGAEERQAELRAIEARTEKERQEAAKAPKAKVQDLGLARVYADLLQTVREKQNNVVASQHDEADKPVSAS